MLERILKAENCAECRICCVYDDSDVWDAPGFTEDEFKRNRIKDRFDYHKKDNNLYYLNMEKNSEGLYTCPCLTDHGCILGKDKPFRCSMWPLYPVKHENGPGFALSPVCPQIIKLSNEDIFSGIYEKIPYILETVRKDPSLLEDFSPEYRMVAVPDETGEYHCLNERYEESDIEIKVLSDEEVINLYKNRMQEDFPSDELKKLNLMLDLKSKDAYLTLGAFSGNELIGYAFFSRDSKGDGLYIFDYLGVRKDIRKKGIGTTIHKMALDSLPVDKVLMGEVEDPFMEEDPEKRSFKLKRMEFYLRNGWSDTGLSLWMYGVDYRILAVAPKDSIDRDRIYRDYRTLYIDMVGEEELSVNIKINDPKEFSAPYVPR